jgi:hypothetical protein
MVPFTSAQPKTLSQYLPRTYLLKRSYVDAIFRSNVKRFIAQMYRIQTIKYFGYKQNTLMWRTFLAWFK